MSTPLHQYNILIADADQLLANVLKMLLGEMGFSNVDVTSSGAAAEQALQKKPFDFLITEWNIRDIDGIELIKHIRCGPASPNPLLPIVMLTGRAEKSDVAMARDSGINEFVVKPFSAQTIYDRLERIIEKPRNFISTSTFVGPDRRHRESAPPTADRRTVTIAPISNPPREKMGNLMGPRPRVWSPDFSLKQKLGPAQKLHLLITPEMLNAAQAAIDAITSDSLQWIKEDLSKLKSLHKDMLAGEVNTYFITELAEVALSISSRAGTFGYTRASEIAYKLYLFYRNKIQPANPAHQVIAQKHIEALQVMLSDNLHGAGGKLGAQIAIELSNLMVKYAP